MEIQEAIMKHVLRYVPAKSLCRFKLVSRDWNNWICSSFLAHQQTTHFTKTSCFFYQSSHDHDQDQDQDVPVFIPLHRHSHGVAAPSLSFLPQPISIRTTSHGLLCCKSTSEENTYFICNPTTKEWQELPKPSLFHGPSSAIALAFSPSTYNFHSHFQLVCAVPVPFDCVNAVYFEIYSSRTNSWRLADSQYCYGNKVDVDADADADAYGSLTFNGDGFCMEGSSFVYWEASNGCVLVFDLRLEDHGEIPLPLPCGLGALMQMRGELCYVMVMTCNAVDSDDEIDVNVDADVDADADDAYYTLGFYGGHDMTLERRIPLDLGDFGRDHDQVVRVLSEVRDGVMMILVGRNLILYDVEERRRVFVRKFGPTERVIRRFLLYVNSLVKVCPVEKMPAEDRHFDELLKNMSIS